MFGGCNRQKIIQGYNELKFWIKGRREDSGEVIFTSKNVKVGIKSCACSSEVKEVSEVSTTPFYSH